MKELFYQNEENIDFLRTKLEQVAKVMTENHAKVLGFSTLMSPRITTLMSFYEPEMERELQDYIYEQTLEELERILKEQTLPLSVPVDSLWRGLLNAVIFNNYIWREQAKKYYPKKKEHEGRLYQRHEKDIARIDGGFPMLLNCLKYLKFEGGAFSIDLKRFEEYIEKNSVYLTNKKQKAVAEKAAAIREAIEGISKIVGRNVSGYWSDTTNYGQLTELLRGLKD